MNVQITSFNTKNYHETSIFLMDKDTRYRKKLTTKIPQLIRVTISILFIANKERIRRHSDCRMLVKRFLLIAIAPTLPCVQYSQVQIASKWEKLYICSHGYADHNLQYHYHRLKVNMELTVVSR